MGLTKKQLDPEARRSKLWASSHATILGLNPYENVGDLMYFMAGKIDGPDENRAMRIGNALEDGVGMLASDHIDGAIDKRGAEVTARVKDSQGYRFIGAHRDFRVVTDTGGAFPLEVKTSGMLGGNTDDWGDSWTDDAPPMYVVQCHVQMICMDVDRSYLYGLVAGKGERIYHIARNDELSGLIVERATEFWENHVLPWKIHGEFILPTNAIVSLSTYKMLRREPESRVEIDWGVVDDYEMAKADVKELTVEAAQKQAAIFRALGEAEGSHPGPDGREVCYLPDKNGKRSLRIRKAK